MHYAPGKLIKMIRSTLKKLFRSLSGPGSNPATTTQKGTTMSAFTPQDTDTSSTTADSTVAPTPEAVEQVLAESIRPALEADGGSIELVRVNGNDVHVRLTGACHGCPSAAFTLRLAVEARLQDAFSDDIRIVDET